MKRLIPLLLLLPVVALSQPESTRVIEPGQQTSYTNKDLILLAAAAFAVLVAAYFIFRRARKRQTGR